MIKKIRVGKITVESLNKLIDLGYDVEVVQTTESPSPFANYEYKRAVGPKKAVWVPKPKTTKVIDDSTEVSKNPQTDGFFERVCTEPHVRNEPINKE